jgi:hypothetical protein
MSNMMMQLNYYPSSGRYLRSSILQYCKRSVSKKKKKKNMVHLQTWCNCFYKDRAIVLAVV